MVILSFSYTSPNISNLIISYKPAVLFLIKNIKKHKKADKSDRKQQQNSMGTAHSSIKKLRKKTFAEFLLKREPAYLTASRTRRSLSSNPSSKSRRNMFAPSLFATAGFS